ncbi:MAG: hypothetical protein C5B57_02945 [Blastocatellia bacterium]|nr:MAG: hypothetical protein C5B57_02945 [Blastocatellia bacterium]
MGIMSESSTIRVTTQITTAAIGIALIGCALAADQRWLDRHFLPSFFVPRRWYVLLESVVRAGIAAVGLSLAVLLRPRVARAVERAPHYPLTVALAVVLALGTSELTLRHRPFRPTGWLKSGEEPLRRPDDRLGWVLVPARTGHDTIGGRNVDYAIDAAGYRVSSVEAPVDPERPTIVFGGESVMFGEGLFWSETIPAQVEGMLGIQSANLAVHGYSSDQMYLRLERELPRFRRPVAVVALFMTALFGRNLDHDRPHLDPDLGWHPPERASRLATLAAFLVPYRSDHTVDRGVVMTRNSLRAIVALAKARQAAPLIVAPNFGTEHQVDRSLRQRILDDTIPYLPVTLDADWRLRWDRHPNAHAAKVIARAIALRLRHR